MSHDDKFYHLESELIRALNGITRPKADKRELESIRSAMELARTQCAQNGIIVEDCWQFAQRERAARVLECRPLVETELKRSPLISQRTRDVIAVIVGAIALVVAELTMSSWWILIVPFVAYLVVELICIEFFPTPAIRIGRIAAENDVDFGDMFQGSPDGKDYLLGYRFHLSRLHRRNGVNYIKVR